MKINANTIESWVKNIPSGLQFFLVYGQEPGQITLISHKLIDQFNDGEADMNISTFPFSQLKDDPSLLIDEMSSNCLFGGKKVIVVEDAPAALPKPFIELLKNPRGSNIVIFIANELRPTSSLRKNFEKLDKCVAIACYKDDKASLQRYVRQKLDKAKVAFTPDVPTILAESLPSNRLLINNELDKLLLYKAGDESPINVDDIKESIADAAEISLDDLCISIALKDAETVQKCISQLIAEDKNFVFTIRVLLKYFMRVYEVKTHMEQGLSSVQAVSKLAPPVFFKQKDNLIRVCTRVSANRAVNLIKRLLTLELQCKNTIADPQMITFNTLTHIAA